MQNIVNQLILGDNLEILKKIESETVDLIYLDPPFFSNRNYEVIWGDSGEVRSFQDRWSGGISHYIDWLKERIQEMYRLLKPTGVLFLHCDWHASSNIRVEILDKVFGENHFRNEIIWKRRTGTNSSVHNAKQFGVVNDTIWFYSKSNKWYFKQLYSFEDTDYQDYVDKFFIHIDEKGRKYRIADLSNPAPRPNLMYEYKGYQPPKNGWAISKEKMETFEKEGRLHFPKQLSGRIQRRRFLDELQGKPIQNLWDDIEIVNHHAKEKIGYPTQKPEKLLKRILECASNEGDVILDPFVGGGTTVAVANQLNRRWIGIDQSVQAVKITELRLWNLMDLFSKPFVTQLHKYDFDTLRYQDAFEFEHFMVHHFGGIPNVKQRGDLGLDGKTLDNIPIQVKRSDGIGRNVVDNFHAAIQRSDKRLYDRQKATNQIAGYIIAFSFGRGAIEEVARLKNAEGLIIKLLRVEDIVPIAKKPSLSVEMVYIGKDKKGLHEIQLKAVGQSAVGIEFYSWDFEYQADKGMFKAMILLDKLGIQNYAFKAGQHRIAVKVVDNDGLENVEIVNLKVNGHLERN